MSRALPTAYTDKAKETAVKALWLVEIETGTTPAQYRFASTAEDVVFPTGGDTYTARAHGWGIVRINLESTSPNELVVADDDGTLKALVTDWKGNDVTIYRAHRDLLALATYAQKDVYRIRSTRPEPGRMTFVLGSKMDVLDLDFPARRVLVNEWPGITTELF